MKKAEQGGYTRSRLVAVAAQLFAERGYENTPIEEVLARAGVSKGALYHHFPNKESLFEAVFREISQQVMENIAKAAGVSDDPLEKLRLGCVSWLDQMMDPAVRKVACETGPLVLGWQKWRQIDQEYYVGMVAKVLQAAVDEGKIAPQNVEMLAHMACAMLGEAAMVIGKAGDVKQAREDAAALVDRMIASLMLEPAASPDVTR